MTITKNNVENFKKLDNLITSITNTNNTIKITFKDNKEEELLTLGLYGNLKYILFSYGNNKSTRNYNYQFISKDYTILNQFTSNTLYLSQHESNAMQFITEYIIIFKLLKVNDKQYTDNKLDFKVISETDKFYTDIKELYFWHNDILVDKFPDYDTFEIYLNSIGYRFKEIDHEFTNNNGQYFYTEYGTIQQTKGGTN